MSVFRVWPRVNVVYNGCAPVGFHFGSVGTLRAGVRSFALAASRISGRSAGVALAGLCPLRGFVCR